MNENEKKKDEKGSVSRQREKVNIGINKLINFSRVGFSSSLSAA